MSAAPEMSRVGLMFLVAVLIGTLVSSASLACTTAQWQAGASGAINPNEPGNSVARIKGRCGLKVTGTGFVQDNSPTAETAFIVHFYFLPQFTGSGTVDLLIAYADDAAITPLFSIRYDGTNIIFDGSAVGGNSVAVAANSNRWNLIELKWRSGASGSLWVNQDSATDPPTAFVSGAGAVEAVRFGAPAGLGGLAGMAVFDEYVSARTQLIGPLRVGDANLDGGVNSGDIDTAIAESGAAILAPGLVDCNLDGTVDSSDPDCIVAEFLNAP